MIVRDVTSNLCHETPNSSRSKVRPALPHEPAGLILVLSFLAVNIGTIGVWANNVHIQKLIGVLAIVAGCLALAAHRTLWGLTFCSFLLVCLLRAVAHVEVIAGICLASLMSMHTLLRREGGRPVFVAISVLILMSFLKLTLQNVAPVWFMANSFSYVLSSVLTFGTRLGVSLSGILTLASMFLIVLMTVPYKDNFREVAGYVTKSIIAYCISLNLIAHLLPRMPEVALNSLSVYIVCQIPVLVSIIARKDTLHAGLKARMNREDYLVAVLLGLTFVAAAIHPSQQTNEGRPTVTLVNDGFMVDFFRRAVGASPPYGYGRQESVFGMLPAYLDTFGFAVDIVDSLSEIRWDGSGTVVLVNPATDLDKSLSRRVQDHVKRGGSVCLAADHTNMSGIQEASNTLLEWSGLRVNDDTADPILHGSGKLWANSLDFFSHPLTIGLSGQHDVQVWSGASLFAKDLTTIPLIIGRFGFSDDADPTNLGTGGRLGNRRFEPREKAGDIVLAVLARYGRGRIALFGDSSPFQSPVLATNWHFLARLFWWLNSRDGFSPFLKHAALISLVSALLGCLIIRKRTIRSGLVAAPVFVLAFLVLVGWINCWHAACLDRSIAGKMDLARTAVVDTVLGERLDSSSLSRNSSAGLAFNLMRTGMTALLSDDWAVNLRGRALFIAAPSRRISSRQSAQLAQFVKQGGVLVLSAGYECLPQIRSLLTEFALDIDPVMLGPVPWKNPNLPETLALPGPEFRDAWPIRVLDPLKTKVYYSFQGYNLVTVTQRGDGVFVLISDSEFLCASNLEGEFQGHYNNIVFLQELLRSVKLNES